MQFRLTPQALWECARCSAIVSLAAAALLSVSRAADAPATKDVLESIRVPDGFTVERIASPPVVERPMLVSFDDRGRMYVADSAGVNLKGDQLAKNPPHVIRMIEDTDGDGVFDASKVFADKLVFPQGILWHDGAVFVSSPPSFWKFTDFNGDGVADRREELVTGFANTGVADDMHGASVGPDGRIYWFAGRFPHEIRKPGGPLIHKGTAPLMLRCNPDGSDVEVVCGTQGNAVGVAFSPEGEMFVSGTFLAPESMGAGLRDAVIHAIDGAEYPVRDRVLNEHKRTGELLPPMTHLGASAPSDIAFYRSGGFGKEFEGNLFSAQFNTHKVMRHVIEPHGATFKARNEDFLVSTNADFHPTDVLEDADGSLIVVDTGGWFRNGCPTSQIAKPDVKGGIYRVRREGMTSKVFPRGIPDDWPRRMPSELAALLDDPRFEVRDRAVHQLAKFGPNALATLADPLIKSVSARTRQHAVWTLHRVQHDYAREYTRFALSDPDPRVRQVAARSAGFHRDARALTTLMTHSKKGDPAVQREAATALGRIRRKEAVPALLEALRDPIDRFLEHALIFALIHIDDRDGTLKGLDAPESSVKRGALIALDQMDSGRLTPEMVTRHLDPSDALLESTALWIIGRHPDWAGAMAPFFREWLAKEVDVARRAEVRGQLLAFSDNKIVQELVAEFVSSRATPAANRMLLLNAIGDAPLNDTPKSWLEALKGTLGSTDESELRHAVAAVRAVRSSKAPVERVELHPALIHIALDREKAIDLRVSATAAAARLVHTFDDGLFAFAIECLTPEQPPLIRMAAADALSSAPLNESQLDRLAGAISTAGPLELSKLLAAFERGGSSELGAKLLGALARSSSGVSAETMERVLKKFPDDVREQARKLVVRGKPDLERQRARLAELEPVLSGGEVQRGHDVFFGNRAACSTCHVVQGQGGRVGPDLSKIAAIRSGRDLLEAVVFPSASFARTFEPFAVTTRDGETHSGIIGREAADEIVLYDSSRNETRIARSEIKELRVSAVSIMPEGLDAQLKRDELADLMAFLQSLR